MNYTYLLESTCVKNYINKYVPNIEDSQILIILCYHISTNSEQPFLQYLFNKSLRNPFITEQFTLPYLLLSDINKDDIMNEVLLTVKHSLTNLYCNLSNYNEENFKGIVYLNSGFPVALVNVSNIDINNLKLSRDSESWFILPSEIINVKRVCNIPIEAATTDMFIEYAPQLSLLHKVNETNGSITGEMYSIPEAVYTGSDAKEIEFNAIFGPRLQINETNDGNTYKFYTSFSDAVLSGGWSNNKSDSLFGKIMTDNEYGRYLKGGINRYALFIDANTIYSNEFVSTTNYATFKPLSYHILDKKTLEDKYDKNNADKYAIL